MKRYIKSSYHSSLLDEIDSLIEDGIYHFENELGSDYDVDDIVEYVEDRVLSEADTYPVSAEFVKDPMGYSKKFYNTVKHRLEELSR